MVNLVPWNTKALVTKCGDFVLLNHLSLKKMAISQTILANVFSWMNSSVVWLKFHWSLFPRVSGDDLSPCLLLPTHYMNQYWLITSTERRRWCFHLSWFVSLPVSNIIESGWTDFQEIIRVGRPRQKELSKKNWGCCIYSPILCTQFDPWHQN